MTSNKKELEFELEKLDRLNKILGDINLSYRGIGIEYKGYAFEIDVEDSFEQIEDRYQELIKTMRDNKINDYHE